MKVPKEWLYNKPCGHEDPCACVVAVAEPLSDEDVRILAALTRMTGFGGVVILTGPEPVKH